MAAQERRHEDREQGPADDDRESPVADRHAVNLARARCRPSARGPATRASAAGRRGSRPPGATRTARASKIVPPAIGASRTSVVSSSMLTPLGGEGRGDLGDDARVVGAEQLEAEPDGLALGRAGPCARRRRGGRARRARAGRRPARRAPSAGTETSTMPANLPARCESWLRSQLPPCALIGAESSDTSPARSSPRTVRTRLAMEAG